MSKLKMTGFGRFFIFILILAPLVYFGVTYLNNSGALDQMKEKLENTTSKDDTPETGKDILNELNKESNRESTSAQEAIIAKQQRKIEELERQNQKLRNEKNTPSSNGPEIFRQEDRANNKQVENSSGAPSLNDLVREAEKNMREKGNNPSTGSSDEGSPNLGGTRQSLATWTFSLSDVNGTLELYQEGDRLLSRTAYAGTSRVDIQELTHRDDRLYVQDSPTGEYYILKSDGNLDAYNRDGFLTTCRRR